MRNVLRVMLRLVDMLAVVASQDEADDDRNKNDHAEDLLRLVEAGALVRAQAEHHHTSQVATCTIYGLRQSKSHWRCPEAVRCRG